MVRASGGCGHGCGNGQGPLGRFLTAHVGVVVSVFRMSVPNNLLQTQRKSNGISNMAGKVRHGLGPSTGYRLPVFRR